MVLRGWGATLVGMLVAWPAAAVEPAFTEMVEMRDGVHLATDVYLPPGDGPWPVIFQRTPYSRLNLRDWAEEVLAEGRAAVGQDVRGRPDSEGVHSIFFSDGPDGYDSLAWIASQPWCDGHIVMDGASAPGISAFLAAGETPPWLSGIFPVTAATDLYSDDVYDGGVFRRYLVANWLWRQHILDRIDEFVVHPLRDEWWSPVLLSERWGAVNVPVLQQGGWFDLYTDSAIESTEALDSEGGPGARGRTLLIIGPWSHSRLGKRELGELAFPETALWDDEHNTWLGDIVDDFLAETLQGQSTGVFDLPMFQYYLMGDVDDPQAPGNAWHESDVWPPPSEELRLFLRAGGSLSLAPPVSGEASATSYVCDPTNPVPSLGGANLYLEQGPYDQSSAESRADVLTFTTSPLVSPEVIVGLAQCDLWISSTATDADFFVKLCDVYPDGRSMLMREGALHARRRNGMDQEDLLEPGQIYELQFDIGHIALALNSGHRLRVSIASTNWPRFEVNPQSGATFRLDDPDTVVATHTVHHSPGFPSQILLRRVPPPYIDPPRIEEIADATVQESQPYIGPTPALSQGTPPITWFLLGGPEGMTIDPSTGVVEWEAPTTVGSPHRVSVQASNEAGVTAESWLLSVTPAPDPPLIEPIPDSLIREPEPYTGPVPVLLQGTPPVTWTLLTGPGGMFIDTLTGVVSWEASVASGNPYTVAIQASNEAGTDEESWLLTVLPALEAPIIEPISDAVIQEPFPYTGPVPGLTQGTPPIAWSLLSGPSGMEISPSTGVVSWAVSSAASSPYTISVQASNEAGSDQEAWTLTVMPGSPEISLRHRGLELPAGSGICDFGSVPIEDEATEILVIENTGYADLHLLGTEPVLISGPQAHVYQLAATPEALVPAGSSTEFAVLFTPDTWGEQFGSLSIANDDPDENPYVVTLRGEGLLSAEQILDHLLSDSDYSAGMDLNGDGINDAADLVKFINLRP